MNRIEVLSRLNDVLAKCNECVEEFQEDFEDTERWLEHLRESAKKLLINGVFVIPITPAGIRKKRRLYVIEKSDYGEESSKLPCGVSKATTVQYSTSKVISQSDGQSQDVIKENKDSSENKLSDKSSTKRTSSRCGSKSVKVAIKRLSRNSLGSDKLSLNGRPKHITRNARSLKKGKRAENDSMPAGLNKENDGNSLVVKSDKVESSVLKNYAEQIDDEFSKENPENEKHCQNTKSRKIASLSNSHNSCTRQVNQAEKLKSHVCESQNERREDLSDHILKEKWIDQIQTSSNILLIPNTCEQINLGSLECNVEKSTISVGDGKNSNVSSAYFSMVNEESHSEKNHSSYLTAASVHENSQLILSDRNKITEEHEGISPKLQQNNILKEKLTLKKTFKSPVRVVKSPHLFSPFANESVKKRVAAYEGLTALNTGNILKTNKRVTRSKARALFAKEQEMKKTNSVQKSSAQQGSRKSINKGNRKLPIRNDVGKENSFLYSANKAHLSSTSKILSDVNVLSTSQVNKMGNIALGNDIWIKKTSKTVQNTEMKKLEDLKKREEKEREVQQRREELLKKRMEEQRRKKEKRLRVMQNKEAQEKEKQESKLRVGRERDEKLNILLHEREVKQREEILKKKLETERKAAEAKRKFEETETARVAKLKMEEKLKEEGEREHKKLVDEKEKLALKEKNNSKLKKVPESTLKNYLQKNAALDPQFHSIPNNNLKSNTIGNSNENNICNLEDLMSGDSDSNDSDDESQPQIAPWAKRPLIHWHSHLELNIMHQVPKVFTSKNTVDVLAIFPNKRLQRSSSARWDSPIRYSCLPVY